MAASVSATYKFQLDVTEQFALGLDLMADGNHPNPHTLTLGGITGTLDDGSSPAAITLAYSDEITLTAGAYTIDLQSLPGPLSTTISFAGKKVQAWALNALATNTAGVTFVVGAANPYNLFGTASDRITLGGNLQQGVAQFYQPEVLPDVSGSAKEIDVSSTDTDAKFQIVMVAG